MENNKQQYIFISRNPKYKISVEYPVDKIDNIHWRNASGEIVARQAGFSLYGYIPYEDAMELDLNSGRHNFGSNSTLICICTSTNTKEPYLSVYKTLCKCAGAKPMSQIAANRPKCAPPCTKKICELLSEQEYMPRKDLRYELLQIGYAITTIRSALRRLERNQKITIEKVANTDNQKISLCK